MFRASRQSPAPFLFRKLDESRAPSLLWRYPDSSVLLAPPTSHPPGPDFGCPYTEPLRPSPATGEISRVTQCNFPRIPSRRPRRVHLLLLSVNSLHRWRRPSPSDHRVGALSQQVTRLYGFLDSTACEFAILLSLGVFSIHLVLRVASQNRIFACGVNR